MFDSEFSILAAYGLFVAFTILLQVTGALNQLGMGYILSARDENRTVTGITARLDRAQTNSVTALALIAPPILMLGIEDRFSPASLQAAQVFLVARVIYLPAYGLGITGLRTLAWLTGFAATAILYFLAL
jgi:uncharacterized MAPEG superfamily protein